MYTHDTLYIKHIVLWIAYDMYTSMYTRSIRMMKPVDESFEKVLENLQLLLTRLRG